MCTAEGSLVPIGGERGYSPKRGVLIHRHDDIGPDPQVVVGDSHQEVTHTLGPCAGEEHGEPADHANDKRPDSENRQNDVVGYCRKEVQRRPTRCCLGWLGQFDSNWWVRAVVGSTHVEVKWWVDLGEPHQKTRGSFVVPFV